MGKVTSQIEWYDWIELSNIYDPIGWLIKGTCSKGGLKEFECLGQEKRAIMILEHIFNRGLKE